MNVPESNPEVGTKHHHKKETNNLFPVFFKLESLSVLIVGGGYVGHEKLSAVISNSPHSNISLVATTISDEIRKIAEAHPNIELTERAFEEADLVGDLPLVEIAILRLPFFTTELR